MPVAYIKCTVPGATVSNPGRVAEIDFAEKHLSISYHFPDSLGGAFDYYGPFKKELNGNVFTVASKEDGFKNIYSYRMPASVLNAEVVAAQYLVHDSSGNMLSTTNVSCDASVIGQ